MSATAITGTNPRRDLTSCQRTVVRYSALFFNFLVLLVGVATVCLGCYVYSRMTPEAIAGYALLVPLKEFFAVGIILGATLVLFSILGTAGAFLRIRVALVLYAGVVLICLVVHVSAGSMAYVQHMIRPDGKITATVMMGEAWNKLDEAGRIKVQIGLDCCGFETPFDRAAASPGCSPAGIPGTLTVKRSCSDVALATIIPSTNLVYQSLFAVAAVELLAFIVCMIVIAYPDRGEPWAPTSKTHKPTAVDGGDDDDDDDGDDDDDAERTKGAVDCEYEKPRVSSLPLISSV